MFQKRMRKSFEESGLVIKEIARLSGVSKRTIDNWMASNPTMPRADDAARVALVVHSSVEYWATGKDSKKWGPPRRIAHIVADLEPLNDQELSAVAAVVHPLGECARRRRPHPEEDTG